MGVVGWCQMFEIHNFKVFTNYQKFVKLSFKFLGDWHTIGTGLEIVCVKYLKHQSINIVNAPQ